MNMLHVEYALEVAKTGSINKAAENLFVAQPNVSRSIKELEAYLGITIFDRSSKGMTLTREGMDFVKSAQNVMNQISAMESLYRERNHKKLNFSVSVPRASYIADAFVSFSQNLNHDSTTVTYREANAFGVLDDVLLNGYKLGVVRYNAIYDEYYKRYFKEHDLHYEPVVEFKYKVVINREHPLADKNISFADLLPYVELCHKDLFVPYLSPRNTGNTDSPDSIKKKIYVFDRGSQFDILMRNNNAFMFMSPLPQKILERYNLIHKIVQDDDRVFKDELIYKNGYTLTDMDKAFLSEVHHSRISCFN